MDGATLCDGKIEIPARLFLKNEPATPLGSFLFQGILLPPSQEQLEIGKIYYFHFRITDMSV